tara:strand:- start:36 stop:200 length:165 start_codon:yes stop_codon:yes gene_type:complete
MNQNEADRKYLLLHKLERIFKREIEHSTNEFESDDWSKIHSQIINLKNNYKISI